jgi:hypothetical protein
MGSSKFSILLLGLLCAPLPGRTEEHHVNIADCSFASRPDEFLLREARTRRELQERVLKFSASAGPVKRPATLAPVPRRNFIDDAIFDRMQAAGVQSSPLTADDEFFRRVHLDLTGRTPTPDAIRAFLVDRSSGKRDELIDRLLYSAEFGHRWTLWMGDLVGLTAQASNVNIQIDGRNAYYVWLRNAVMAGKSYKDIAYELIGGVGNNYDHASGAANYAVRGRTPMGPAQDTYDTMLARTAGAFLGVAHYDCLLCHDGRRHLDQISLWGGQATRIEAQLMAAFFSRQRLTAVRTTQSDFYYNSINVAEADTGNYALNTNFGNRPNRVPAGALRNLIPEYRNGQKPVEGLTWRESFAHHMSQDRLFAINAVNRMWKQFFGMGLVEPVDAMDPARLDPNRPPPEPWTLQATHPELLAQLADSFTSMNFNMREFIKLLLQSSAYQLSSRSAGEWKYDYLTVFARHYPRRLEGEEVHDVLVNASGVATTYALRGLDPVEWAVQLPEPAEPRSNRGSFAFMDAFFRGNRDTQQRSQSGSILQQMYLMNDAFVLNRIRTASPTLREAARLSDDAALEEIYLRFLSRKPADDERAVGTALLRKATTAAARNAAIEDLAWVCVNKLEFLFSY